MRERTTWGGAAVCLAVFVGCGAGADSVSEPGEATSGGAAAGAPAEAPIVGYFEGHVDATAGTMEVAYREASASGVKPLAVPAGTTLPYGTGAGKVYFHTNSVSWDGGAHVLSGSVNAVNGFTFPVASMTAYFDGASDSAVTSNLPIDYGTVVASGSSSAKTWTFNSPSGGSFTFWGHATGTVGTGIIAVTEATYGANCGIATNGPGGAMLTRLKAYCDGKTTSCTYPASGPIYPTYEPDPAVGCKKNYVAKWTCDGIAALRSPLTVCPGGSCEAGFTNVPLTCP